LPALDLNTSQIAIIAVGVSIILFAASLVALVLAAYWLMSAFLYRISGWANLTGVYGTSKLPDGGRVFRSANLRVGPVRWRRCVTVGILPEGLYLELKVFARHYPPVLIPWRDIVRVTDTRLYWFRAKELRFSQPQTPPVTVQLNVFQEMQAKLSTGYSVGSLGSGVIK
jgi:hypothetical protein